MTSTRRASMRRFLRDLDKIGVTDRQKELAKAVYLIPRDIDSIAASMDPWSTPVMQTLSQFVSDCGFTTDLDESLHRHPGPTSEVKPAGLVLSWMATNWKERTFQRTKVGVALGKTPQHLAEEYGLVDSTSGDIWIPPVYSAIQNQQKRLEAKIRDGVREDGAARGHHDRGQPQRRRPRLHRGSLLRHRRIRGLAPHPAL